LTNAGRAFTAPFLELGPDQTEFAGQHEVHRYSLFNGLQHPDVFDERQVLASVTRHVRIESGRWRSSEFRWTSESASYADHPLSRYPGQDSSVPTPRT